MTTEAATSDIFRIIKARPGCRFFNGWKSEYPIIALKFFAGLAAGLGIGLAGSKLDNWGGTIEAFGSLCFPSATDSIIDFCLKNDQPSDHSTMSSEKMMALSAIASYTGSLMGSVASILLLKPQLEPVQLGLVGVNSIFGALFGLAFPSSKPPTDLTLG